MAARLSAAVRSYEPASMRIKGILRSWNDERGFGFIAPIQGGQEVFVHIKAFGARNGLRSDLMSAL